MIYTFKASSRVTGVDPQVVGEELERIRSDYGILQTKTVVDEARPETAPLHPAFEWDDEVAAEHYREHQARSLIKSVLVINPDTKAKEPMYVHVTMVDDERKPVHYYQSVNDALKSEAEWAAAVAGLKSKMADIANSLASLAQVAGDERKERLAQTQSLVQQTQNSIGQLGANP